MYSFVKNAMQCSESWYYNGRICETILLCVLV